MIEFHVFIVLDVILVISFCNITGYILYLYFLFIKYYLIIFKTIFVLVRTYVIFCFTSDYKNKRILLI